MEKIYSKLLNGDGNENASLGGEQTCWHTYVWLIRRLRISLVLNQVMSSIIL
jgi:hypothetical protein